MSNCLYNGVELPSLPEWDKETYPYAVIQQLNSRWFKLWVMKEKPYVSGNYLHITSDSLTWDNYYAFDNTYTDAWGSLGAVSTASQTASSFIWSNADILNEDGTLYLAASDPIPVTTATPIDPTSLYFLSGLLFVQKRILPLTFLQ
jgi:hypothetical protein